MSRVYLVKEMDDKGQVIEEVLYSNLPGVCAEAIKIGSRSCKDMVQFREFLEQFTKSILEGSFDVLSKIVEISPISFEDGYYNPERSRKVWALVNENDGQVSWFINYEKAFEYVEKNILYNLFLSPAPYVLQELRAFGYYDNGVLAITLNEWTVED